jgi:hypothetical protein
VSVPHSNKIQKVQEVSIVPSPGYSVILFMEYFFINSCNYGRIDGLIRSYMHNIHTLQTISVIIIIVIIHNQEKILRSIHKIYIQITGKNSSQPAEFMMRLAE